MPVLQESADAARNLNESNKAVSNAINNLLNSLPGQKDVDSAIKEVARASIMISDNQFPNTKVTVNFCEYSCVYPTFCDF